MRHGQQHPPAIAALPAVLPRPGAQQKASRVRGAVVERQAPLAVQYEVAPLHGGAADLQKVPVLDELLTEGGGVLGTLRERFPDRHILHSTGRALPIRV